MATYGIAITEPQIGLTILANIEMEEQNKYGLKFRLAMQAIHKNTYHIPLVQQQGQCQPHKPSKKAKKQLCEANSVYDLSSTEQAIECIPRWLPSQDNLVESKPSRQLDEMVANHRAQC